MGHYCGRRNDMINFVAGMKGVGPAPVPDEGSDEWRPPREDDAPTGTNAGFRTCSYCGSLHPDDFLELIVEHGWTLGPTDKNYKVYVQSQPDRPLAELLAEREMRARRREAGEVVDEPPPNRHGKFYFQHLDAVGQEKFIGLLNAGVLRIGYPGHFYRLPYFIQRKP